jgi:hypothetical protein
MPSNRSRKGSIPNVGRPASFAMPTDMSSRVLVVVAAAQRAICGQRALRWIELRTNESRGFLHDRENIHIGLILQRHATDIEGAAIERCCIEAAGHSDDLLGPQVWIGGVAGLHVLKGVRDIIDDGECPREPVPLLPEGRRPSRMCQIIDRMEGHHAGHESVADRRRVSFEIGDGRLHEICQVLPQVFHFLAPAGGRLNIWGGRFAAARARRQRTARLSSECASDDRGFAVQKSSAAIATTSHDELLAQAVNLLIARGACREVLRACTLTI